MAESELRVPSSLPLARDRSEREMMRLTSVLWSIHQDDSVLSVHNRHRTVPKEFRLERGDDATEKEDVLVVTASRRMVRGERRDLSRTLGLSSP